MNNYEKKRIKVTIEEIASLNKNIYCDLGPGKGFISQGLNEKSKNVIAVEAPWASEDNKKWAKKNAIPMYLFEFFTGDFNQIKEEVDCFILSHAIAHFRFSPYIFFKKLYNKLPKGGLFYLSTVNGCSFERVVKLFKGKPIIGKVSKEINQGYLEFSNDFNRTEMKQIWDDWMHVKEYTKPELEEMFTNLGFKIHTSTFRNHHSHWKKNIATARYPHLSEEIIIIGEK